jgi:hypothetical protein
MSPDCPVARRLATLEKDFRKFPFHKFRLFVYRQKHSSVSLISTSVTPWIRKLLLQLSSMNRQHLTGRFCETLPPRPAIGALRGKNRAAVRLLPGQFHSSGGAGRSAAARLAV